MDVLQDRAHELMAPLKVAEPLNHEQLDGVELSLSSDHQLTNAGLVVSLCKRWLQRTGNWEKISDSDTHEDKFPKAFLRGLSSARLPGRAQIVYDSPAKSISSEKKSGDLIFYLDGAHIPEKHGGLCQMVLKCRKRKQFNIGDTPPSESKLMLVQVGGGIIAGPTTFCITTPLDTIKTQLQVMGFEKRPSVREVVRNLIQEDGWQGLYRGLGPRFFSMSAWGTLMILAYEFFKWLVQKMNRFRRSASQPLHWRSVRSAT